MAALSPEDLASEFPFKPKRGGRKPGSKNKPKPSVGVQDSDGELQRRIDLLLKEVVDLRTAHNEACRLLERATCLRIGLNDSENRVMELTRLRAQLETEALAVLRAGLSA